MGDWPPLAKGLPLASDWPQGHHDFVILGRSKERSYAAQTMGMTTWKGVCSAATRACFQCEVFRWQKVA
ncbi:hypothetical protein CIT26_07495 [Mesorhizobium temperatum]|uniref:Uncharacterized protein n=1 Tax=Mesorhizobium temperatum TaxID=241416 RepID=A0A271LTP1_9HYPH|nr:hypothetical protein CIT26_07495 [Mesorhizobium temperatum]